MPNGLIQTDNGLMCPNCGGFSFETQHSKKRKVTFGIMALVATPNQVRCVTCRSTYKRK